MSQRYWQGQKRTALVFLLLLPLEMSFLYVSFPVLYQLVLNILVLLRL